MEGANRFFGIEVIRAAQVDDRFGIGDFPEGRLDIDILAVSVDLQSVMALDAVAEHVPAGGVLSVVPEGDALFLQHAVQVAAQVICPADAVGLKAECSGIHVTVEGVAGAALYRQPGGIYFVSGPHDRHGVFRLVPTEIGKSALEVLFLRQVQVNHQQRNVLTHAEQGFIRTPFCIRKDQIPLGPVEELGSFEVMGKEGHLKGDAPVHAAIRMIEPVSRRGGHCLCVLACMGEAGICGKAEIGPERIVQHTDQIAEVQRAVAPVAGSLRVGAVGVIAFADVIRHTFHRPGNDFLRKFGINIRHRDGTCHQSAVADGVPVGRHLHPPAVAGEGGFQPLFDDRRGEFLPLFGGEEMIKPVVPDRQRKSHFRRIKEVIRIPVREVGGVFQFSDRPFGVLFFAGEHVRHRKMLDRSGDFPAGEEHLFVTDHPFDRGHSQKQVCIVNDPFRQRLTVKCLCIFPDHAGSFGRDEQARMGVADPGDIDFLHSCGSFLRFRGGIRSGSGKKQSCGCGEKNGLFQGCEHDFPFHIIPGSIQKAHDKQAEQKCRRAAMP